MNISTNKMTNHEWLKQRQKGIGGSDVAAILGFNPYKTPLDVYNDKTSQEPIETEINARMEAGLRLEETIAQWWSDQHGLKVQRDNKIRIHRKYSFLLANLDRIIVGNGNGRGTGILEVKSTNKYAYEQWKDDGLPLTTYSQIQHYLNVTGHKWGAVAVLIDGFDLRSLDIEPDKIFIKLMTNWLLHFWNNHVLKKIPPQPTTNEEIKKLFPEHVTGKVVEATQETVDLWKQAKELRNSIDSFKMKQEQIDVQLKTIIGDAEQLVYNEQVLATFKKSKPSETFDKASFKNKYPDLYKSFISTKSGIRRFLLKEAIV